MGAMTRRIVLSTVVALVLAACSSDDSTTSTTAPPPPPTADAELTTLVRDLEGPSGVHVVEVLRGDPVTVVTNLARTPEEGPTGLGICINTQAAVGGAPEVRVLTADGGTIASTRNGFCGIRV